MTLFEVIVALALLVSLGAASVALLASATRAGAALRQHDADTLAADQFLRSISLWSGEDLDARLGRRENGLWVVDIERSTRALYRVRVTLRGNPFCTLETVLYRPTQHEG